METVFVLTHTLMIICLLSILYVVALPDTQPFGQVERYLVPLLFQVKSFQITPLRLYRAAVGFLALIIR
jgi:hypothetical protein